MQAQGRLILAIDGLQPDVGHEVLWVVREVLSREVLLARSLLSSAERELTPLLREAVAGLEVPVVGAVSDGQHSIRNAVAAAFPGQPHQLCHFHYLRQAAGPIWEADRHAKKELKKRVRGIRPLERAVEGREDEEAEIVQGYCAAVRSALSDDGRAPLEPSGLKLEERLSAIAASLDRATEQKGGSKRKPLAAMRNMLRKAREATAALWPDVRAAFAWVHEAAEILENRANETGEAVRRHYEALLPEFLERGHMQKKSFVYRYLSCL